ncbi:glycosyltransferase family 2 protein [Caballeronia sp. LZ062]|uniref:glycosyltransferase family 2 protein n=1 Tax=unclassified Caballeronia TaxID=2646786 RepID=UPI0028579E33|nr:MULTISPECIES: glycosyltransferase family 2 protein [unclassified Caballeronia]MDR5855211.1 glycosyltransferase family 2 protein [Caballeronia sp. LZ050]MDR5870260.1 glycosyltransferase family 2 protein [Caballeronia sp. LZ062]
MQLKAPSNVSRLADPRLAQLGAVVVFYNPDAGCIERANRLAQWCRCVVVDNTPGREASERISAQLDASIVYLPNHENLGIATALNQGIESLIADGFRLAMLFDQDSDSTLELITGLADVAQAANKRGEPVALVGPAYEDARLRGLAPFVRFGYFRLERVMPHGDVPIDVDFLITSGSCVNLAYWRDIGPMDDSLFIDFVDTEWCMRAKSRGFRVLGVPWIGMRHELGDEPIRAFGRNYPMHSAVRHYYLFRNAVALLKRGYVPCTWKSTELIKLPVRIVIYACFTPDGATHVKMACRGLWHGMVGRMGPLTGRSTRRKGTA